MRWLYVFALLTVAAAARDAERVGYFWHITDMHYDALYHSGSRKGCLRPEHEGGVSRSQRGPMGHFGDYRCDAPWSLIESAVYAMTQRNENVDFILWTGDTLSHTAHRHSESVRLELLQNLTDLLSKTFSSDFVFPALGHEDPISRKKLGEMWSRWLPTDSLKTFVSGGYYIIERKTLKLQIVVLNTNLMTRGDNDEDAVKQWKWLNTVLKKFYRNGETVYLVGHVAPGSNERQKGAVPPTHSHAFTDYHNKRFLRIVREYADIIVGQFFGHLHSDTFRVIYNDRDGRPVSWAMLAPSLTPKRIQDGPNNPGLRLYKFDQDTGQVLDYQQYYLDLPIANKEVEAKWKIEYNFSSYYGIHNITPVALHSLAEKLSLNNHLDNPVFNRYYAVNSVKVYNNPHLACDAHCAHVHYCAITRVDYEEFSHCLKTAPSALSSSSPMRSSLVVLRQLITAIICALLLDM